MDRCAVQTCIYNSTSPPSHVALFTPPVSEILFGEWRKRIPQLTPNGRVCELHFRDREVIKTRMVREKGSFKFVEKTLKVPRLTENVIPSIFSDESKNKKRDQITRSSKRISLRTRADKLARRKLFRQKKVNSKPQDESEEPTHVEEPKEDEDKSAYAELFAQLMTSTYQLPDKWTKQISVDPDPYLIFSQVQIINIPQPVPVHFKQLYFNKDLSLHCKVLNKLIEVDEHFPAQEMQGVESIIDLIKALDEKKTCLGSGKEGEFHDEVIEGAYLDDTRLLRHPECPVLLQDVILRCRWCKPQRRQFQRNQMRYEYRQKLLSTQNTNLQNGSISDVI